jgi:hypothetical protein
MSYRGGWWDWVHEAEGTGPVQISSIVERISVLSRNTMVERDIAAFLARCCGRFQTTLGDQVIGIYLYGSAATGEFVAGKSDIDLIVVGRAELPADAIGKLHDLLAASALPFWLAGFDCGLLPATVAASPEQEVRWDVALQVKRQGGRLELRQRDRVDRRLILDLAMARERGRALVGPEARAIFAPVPATWLRAACLEDVRIWAGRDMFHDPASGVLNACRAWRYAEEGVLATKLEGGIWACSRVAQPSLIEAALAQRRGLAGQALPDADVKAFCQDILGKLKWDEEEREETSLR